MTADRSADLLEIQQLKGRYFYTLDTKRWDDWCALFVPEAAMIVENRDSARKTMLRYEGIDAMIAFVRSRVETVTTVHHGHTPLIDFDGDNEASGIWAMQDILDFGAQGRFYGYGHYHEKYRRVDGRWKIAELMLTRLLVDSSGVSPTAATA